MKSVRSELATLASVLAVPTALALVFPYEALDFKAVERKPAAEAVFSFVRLSPEVQRRAFKAARTSWRAAEDVRRMRVPLSVETLPNDDNRPMGAETLRPAQTEVPPVSCGRVPYAPSFAAPVPERISSDSRPTMAPVFSRKELLELK